MWPEHWPRSKVFVVVLNGDAQRRCERLLENREIQHRLIMGDNGPFFSTVSPGSPVLLAGDRHSPVND